MLQAAGTMPVSAPIHPGLLSRLIARIEKDEKVSTEQADRIMRSTLDFLTLCAENPKRRFAPSPLVDVGWHTFILYTRDYARFCREKAGRFIHHAPNDNPATPMAGGGACATVAFMKKRGIAFDKNIWAHETNKCSDCDGGGGPGCENTNCTCS